jgi:hypothetical protein
VYAASLALLTNYFLPLAWWTYGLLPQLSVWAIPVAIGVAVLRYRLYDIDRLINRTLVYGLLTALLGTIYAGAVLGLGQLFGGIAAQPPSWAVAGATLAVAALFQPARRRIQQAVDRRFNRRKYNTVKTILQHHAYLLSTARVNLSEAGSVGNHCVVAGSSFGWLIQTGPGSAGGRGGLRTNRSGWVA